LFGGREAFLPSVRERHRLRHIASNSDGDRCVKDVGRALLSDPIRGVEVGAAHGTLLGDNPKVALSLPEPLPEGGPRGNSVELTSASGWSSYLPFHQARP
jgi:hypothetical protein